MRRWLFVTHTGNPCRFGYNVMALLSYVMLLSMNVRNLIAYSSGVTALIALVQNVCNSVSIYLYQAACDFKSELTLCIVPDQAFHEPFNYLPLRPRLEEINESQIVDRSFSVSFPMKNGELSPIYLTSARSIVWQRRGED